MPADRARRGRRRTASATPRPADAPSACPSPEKLKILPCSLSLPNYSLEAHVRQRYSGSEICTEKHTTNYKPQYANIHINDGTGNQIDHEENEGRRPHLRHVVVPHRVGRRGNGGRIVDEREMRCRLIHSNRTGNGREQGGRRSLKETLNYWNLVKK